MNVTNTGTFDGGRRRLTAPRQQHTDGLFSARAVQKKFLVFWMAKKNRQKNQMLKTRIMSIMSVYAIAHTQAQCTQLII